MKVYNFTTILTIIACLIFLSTEVYAWEDIRVVEDYDYYEDTGGDGAADTYTYYTERAEAQAEVEIEDEETNTWAEADTYETRKVYIVDYDGETLTATATGYCSAEADAFYDTETSAYIIVAECDAWAIGCGLSIICSAQAVVIYTDTSDTDSDYFISDPVDMSYNGATIYYGHSASADSEAFYTSNFLYIDGHSWSNAYVSVVEE